MKHIIVSIVNYKNHEDTVLCLKSLQKLDTNNLDVSYIISNNDEQKFILPQDLQTFFHDKITFLQNEKNLGFAGGHNVAIRHAQEKDIDAIMILNNDTIVDENCLKEMIVILSKENCGIVCPKIYFTKGQEFHKNRYREKDLGKVIWYAGGFVDWKNCIGKNRGVDEVDIGQFNTAEEIEIATGCCMLIRLETLKRVGYFDERYFLYYEDADLSMRVKNAGFTIWYSPKAIVWHNNAGSAGGSGSNLQDYYISRNRILFGMTYAPRRTKFALLVESSRLMKNGRDYQKKGIRDFYLRRFGKGSYSK